MSQRRENRVAAMQFMYAWRMNPYDHRGEGIRRFFEALEQPRDYYAFAEDLVNGMLDNLEEIDATIRKYAKNWEFDRIARVDLAILQLALYEMKFRNDIPPIVSINEAIDLSKEYSSDESKRFINGILDRFKQELTRPLREAGG